MAVLPILCLQVGRGSDPETSDDVHADFSKSLDRWLGLAAAVLLGIIEDRMR
jgi:hypothetical protein